MKRFVVLPTLRDYSVDGVRKRRRNWYSIQFLWNLMIFYENCVVVSNLVFLGWKWI
jgi:hypothetical protein